MIELPFLTELALHMISGASGVIGIGQYIKYWVSRNDEVDQARRIHDPHYWLNTEPEIQKEGKDLVEVIEKVTPLVRRLQTYLLLRYGIILALCLLVLVVVNIVVANVVNMSELQEKYGEASWIFAASILVFVFYFNYMLPHSVEKMKELLGYSLKKKVDYYTTTSLETVRKYIKQASIWVGLIKLGEHELELLSEYSRVMHLIQAIEAHHAQAELSSASDRLTTYGEQIGIKWR